MAKAAPLVQPDRGVVGRHHQPEARMLAALDQPGQQRQPVAPTLAVRRGIERVLHGVAVAGAWTTATNRKPCRQQRVAASGNLRDVRRVKNRSWHCRAAPHGRQIATTAKTLAGRLSQIIVTIANDRPPRPSGKAGINEQMVRTLP